MKTFEWLSIVGSMVAVGVALGAVVVGSNANLRTELRADIRALESRLSTVESRLSTVEQRQARAEGLLEGLRDAIAARDVPSPGSQGGEAS